MRSSGGADRGFWEDHWEGRDLGHAVRRLATDPVAAALDAHLPSGSRLLEGGCGQGEYVVYERARGVWTVGLDFALDPLLALRALAPELPLVVGDVHALPFRDGSLPAYYSGGVVEHFEGGPEPALAEAHRVLAPDGILLVSVPYLSPLRRMLRWFRRDRWFAVSTTRAEVPRGQDPSSSTSSRRASSISRLPPPTSGSRRTSATASSGAQWSWVRPSSSGSDEGHAAEALVPRGLALTPTCRSMPRTSRWSDGCWSPRTRQCPGSVGWCAGSGGDAPTCRCTSAARASAPLDGTRPSITRFVLGRGSSSVSSTSQGRPAARVSSRPWMPSTRRHPTSGNNAWTAPRSMPSGIAPGLARSTS